MIETNDSSKRLSTYIDDLQKKGRIVFRLDEAAETLGITLKAIRLSAYRLSRKNRIFRAYRNFYLIVPLEYQDVGCPPPDWFIDSLMNHMGTEYYVGLLSAAALHGATHQQPMLFQVMTSKYSRLIPTPRLNIQLYRNNSIHQIGMEQKKTIAGYMQISTPELTAFDLVKYAKASGYYNHISTVLTELVERINGKKLLSLAKVICQERGNWIYWQRLGYLLDLVGGQDIVHPLSLFIENHTPRFGYLVTGSSSKTLEKNQRWRLYINDTIEADL